MSGSDDEGGDPGDEDRRREKKKKKKKKRRTPEEKEARRRRKEAEGKSNAESLGGTRGGDGGGVGSDDDDDEDDDERSSSFFANDGSKSTRARSESRNGRDVNDDDAEREPVASLKTQNTMAGKKKTFGPGFIGEASKRATGLFVSALTSVGVLRKPVDLNDGYDGPIFVEPSLARARKHARAVNVMQTRPGIQVFLDDEVLEHLDGDEIFSELYGQCERRGICVSRVTKTGRTTATVEDVPLSQAEDLQSMGVLIAGRRVRCVKETLKSVCGDDEEDAVAAGQKKHRTSETAFDPEAGEVRHDLIRPYDLKTTGAHELGELGVGIGLYFHSLLWAARVFGILSVMGAFTSVTYLAAGLNSDQLASESLTWLALPTLGAAAWSGERGVGLVFGKRLNPAVMLIITSVECSTAIAFIFLVKKMKRDQTQAVDDMDVSNVSLQDYAVKVDAVPKTATAEEIGTFFSKFGKVHQVTLGTDVGKLIGKHKKRSEMMFHKEELEAAVAKSRGKDSAALKKLRALEKAFEKLETSLLEAQEKSGTNRVTSAFVTFETEDARLHCEKKMKPDNTLAWVFRRKKYKLRGTHRLWIHRAPEASDVLWENLGVNGSGARLRRLLSWVCMSILMVCTCAMVVVAESARSTVPPAIACAPPKEAGTLDCDAIWPAAASSGNASAAILVEVEAMMSQVDAVTCTQFVSGGQWRDTEVGAYDGLGGTLDAASYYDSKSGVWSGGFDATTIKDECSALACFDCFCKARVWGLALVAAGLAEDADGYYALCETYFTGQAFGFATTAFTAVLNVLLGAFTRVFSEFERHHTKSGLESSVSVKLFLALVANSALIPVLVFAKVSNFGFLPYLFQGPYEDFEVDWYQTVSKTLSTTILVNALVFPVTALAKGVARRFSRVVFSSRALTQRRLDALHEGAVFDVSERYAQMLASVFLALCFQAAMPLLVPAIALASYLTYHEAKYTLLRGSKKPPAFDETMARFFWRFAPSAAYAKLLLSTWMLSYSSVPSYGVALSPLSTALDPISASDDDAPFAFSTRFRSANGAVAFLACVATAAYAFLNQNRKLLAGSFARCFPARAFAEDEERSSVPDLSVALSDDILKGLPTYMIGANPEYNLVVPASATRGAGGARQPRPEAWERVASSISAAEEERARLEMKRMTATFAEEAAGEYSQDVRNLLGKKQKKKRSKGKVAPEGEGILGVGNPELVRKNTIEALAWGDDDADAGGSAEDKDARPDAEDERGEVDGESAEEKAERRRRRKERKERKRRERGEE